MPLDNNELKSKEWLERANSYTSKLSQTYNLRGIDQFNMYLTGRQGDLISLLEGLTEDIDKPLLKGLATDLIDVFNSLYIDEDVICCLIRNLLLQLGAETFLNSLQDYVKFMSEKHLDGIHIDKGNFQLFVNETEFGKAIDRQIALIDIILTFMTLDLSEELVAPTLDFIREISEAAVGFLCIAMQEIVYTLRDSTINWIIDKIDEKQDPESIMKCLPYLDFMSVMKKYINDYGMTDKLLALVNGYIGEQHKKFKKFLTDKKNDKKNDKKDKDGNTVPHNLKMIEFLKLVRGIFVNIKESVVSFEFCAFLSELPEFTQDDIDKQDSNPFYRYIRNQTFNQPNNANITANNIVFGDDNTILRNSTTDSAADSTKYNNTKLAVDNELRSFLRNYMGISSDKADQMLTAGIDNNDGNANKISNNCDMILDSNDINDIINSFINNSRIS